jgi:hypothetical protein
MGKKMKKMSYHLAYPWGSLYPILSEAETARTFNKIEDA